MSANHVPFKNTSGIDLNIFPYLYIFDNYILIRISNDDKHFGVSGGKQYA
jgi:hypothetical protein